MRKRRYLAPWHRERGAVGSGGSERVEMGEMGEGMDGEGVEVVERRRGRAAIYHCVSRIVNRDFVLGREEKEKFVGLMRLYERFCQVRVLNFCVMSNHFHLLLEVPAVPADGGASWSDEEVLGHLEGLYCGARMRELRWELEHYRAQGSEGAAAEFRQGVFGRMWDLSAYMKQLKQRFTQWFNRRHGRVGVLWEGRFRSVLVEDGEAARMVSAYIDLNPVRAGLVRDPKDYRWSGYGEALGGKVPARGGLRAVMGKAESEESWREVARGYRELLMGGEGPEGQPGRKKGELSEGEYLRSRARHLTEGLVYGTEGFVNGVYLATREYFGSARRSGARKLRGVRTAMRAMRDLRREAITSPSG